MADASHDLHESRTELSDETQDFHRALVSLQEELEAVDWYRQRAECCSDGELRAVLRHNMREEIEHAAMVLEWLRRRDEHFDAHLRTYLWSQAPITEVEDAATSETESPPVEATSSADKPEPVETPDILTLGRMKQ